MNNNFKQKAKDFFKKEGFFVVLFICLCIVTMVAAISIKKAKVDDGSPEVAVEQSKAPEIAKKEEEPKKTDTKNNADLATKNQKPVTKPVANKEVKFVNPVEGNISHKYEVTTSNDKEFIKMVERTDGSTVTLHGMNIDAKAGTDVKSADAGRVEKVEREPNGLLNVIEIKHSNGITVKYANLDQSTITVKAGDVVKASQVIGKVGKTSVLFDKEKFGEFLNLQVWKNEKQENPTKYFTEYKEKK